MCGGFVTHSKISALGEGGTLNIRFFPQNGEAYHIHLNFYHSFIPGEDLEGCHTSWEVKDPMLGLLSRTRPSFLEQPPSCTWQHIKLCKVFPGCI